MADSKLLSSTIRKYSNRALNFSEATNTKIQLPMDRLHNFTYSGPYRVAGTTKIIGAPNTPVSARVLLIDQARGFVIRTTRSNANGEYAFTQIVRGPWMVITSYDTADYKSVSFDRVYGIR